MPATRRSTAKRKFLGSSGDETGLTGDKGSNGFGAVRSQKPARKRSRINAEVNNNDIVKQEVSVVSESDAKHESIASCAPRADLTQSDGKRLYNESKNQVNSLSVKKEKNDCVSDSESDITDDDDGENGLSAFEQRRLSNIRANTEFLSKINMQEALLDIKVHCATSQKFTQASNKRKFKKKEVLPARPRSLRLQRKDPDGIQLPDLPVPAVEPVNEHPRLASGPLLIQDCAMDDGDVMAFENLRSLSELDIWTCPDQEDDKYEQVTKSLSKLELHEKKVVKVVQNRVFSLAVHPNAERLLVAAGDKWGQLGFWDVNSEASDHGISVYTPHSRPVNCLRFSPVNAAELVSTSYDGTVRCCHFETGQFSEWYRTSDEYEERCIAFDFHADNQLIVARSDGTVVRIDSRERSSAVDEFQVQDKTLKCVSVHPRDQNYFITSDNSGSVHLFDLRLNTPGKRLKSLQELCLNRSVNSAYFSPITGKYILTTAMNDTVCIYDSSRLDQISVKHRIPHDNHTGRWLTGFRASWHPGREDVFVVGSMARPRQIDLYNSSGRQIHTLKKLDTLCSVCSINVLHPTIPSVVGANSSGKLHAFL